MVAGIQRRSEAESAISRTRTKTSINANRVGMGQSGAEKERGWEWLPMVKIGFALVCSRAPLAPRPDHGAKGATMKWAVKMTQMVPIWYFDCAKNCRKFVMGFLKKDLFFHDFSPNFGSRCARNGLICFWWAFSVL